MNNNMMIAGVVGLVVIVGIGMWFMQSKNTQQTEQVEVEEEVVIEPTAGAAMTEGNVVEFEVEGSPFAFDVKEMKVKKGDTVKITFTNKEGMHDWVIDEFDAKTKVLKAGESETIEFVVDQTGEFEYYCSVGTHRAQGMVGTLIVE